MWFVVCIEFLITGGDCKSSSGKPFACELVGAYVFLPIAYICIWSFIYCLYYSFTSFY